MYACRKEEGLWHKVALLRTRHLDANGKIVNARSMPARAECGFITYNQGELSPALPPIHPDRCQACNGED